MEAYLRITSALSDPTRVRALLALREGELCLCQLIDLLGLAPSTVSKHLSLLHDAGLVQRRKEGRWHYYRLVGRAGSPAARAALRWTLNTLRDEPVMVKDAKALCCIKQRDLSEVTTCYA